MSRLPKALVLKELEYFADDQFGTESGLEWLTSRFISIGFSGDESPRVG